MSEITNSFPPQKISYRKKDKKWREACVDYCIGAGVMSRNTNFRASVEEIQSYYDLYNSIFNEKDLKYVTNPFKQDDGFPATAQDHNIIRPKIDLLLGEETKMPFNFTTCRTSDIAAGEIQDKAKQMLMDYIQAAIMSKMSPEDQQRFQEGLESGEIQTPEQIADYLQKDYKDIAEVTAYHCLKYLVLKLDLRGEWYRGYKDLLIAGEEYYYVGILNGEPVVERVNPEEFTYELASNEQYAHEANSCCRHMIMSANDIYDRYYDKLSEKDLDELLEMVEGTPGSYGPNGGSKDLDYNSIKTRIYNSFPNYNPYNSDGNIDVYHTCWRSYEKIGFVTILTEQGTLDTIEVDETYKPTGQELDISWEWIVQIWEGYRAGDKFYFGIAPIEYQHVSIDNPNSQKLPYTGKVYSNTNSKPKSLVAIIKPLQYWYIMLWYRLELAISRDKGKILNMDVTQIPKSMGIDLNKWLHYISALGINFINPYDEGWNVTGREGGKPASFNQITTVDSSMANVIDGYINLMSKIESMVSELSGITPQRQGAISSRELVGSVERSVVQSANITEPIRWEHNQVKKHVLTMLLDTAKHAWRNTNKQKLNYIFDDGTRALMTISEEFMYEDFDIFITDSTKENQNLEQMKQLVASAVQNGASLLEAAEAQTADNITKLKIKLKEIEDKRAEQEAQRAQQEQEAQAQLMQMQNDAKDNELMLKEAELDLKRYEIDQNNATKIAVAQLNAYRGVENMDQNNNGIPDPIEIGKQALEQQKISKEEYTKNKELAFKKEIEEKKIALDKQKMQAAKELQEQKDKAAMEREELKSKTALRNKVVGEK